MIASLVLMVVGIQYGTATNTQIVRMSRGTYQFPIEYILEDGQMTLAGVGMINFDTNNLDSDLPYVNATGLVARGISIGNNMTQLDFDPPRVIQTGGIAQIGVDRGSEFVERVPSFLISPISESEDVLVLNPSNPPDFAYDSEIFYTPMRHQDALNRSWFRTIMRISNSDDSSAPTTLTSEIDFIPSRIASVEPPVFHLPEQVWSVLLSRLHALNLSFSGGGRLIRVYDIDADRLASLPSFLIIIVTEDNEQVVIGEIQPIDYLIPADTYLIPADSGSSTTGHVILFSPGQDLFELTPRITSNILVHFDYTNSRIGFGDPLVQL